MRIVDADLHLLRQSWFINVRGLAWSIRQDSSGFESFVSTPPRCIFLPNYRRNQCLLLTRFLLLASERPLLAVSLHISDPIGHAG